MCPLSERNHSHLEGQASACAQCTQMVNTTPGVARQVLRAVSWETLSCGGFLMA